MRRLSREEFERDREEYMTERKATNTAFILMFPTLIMAMMGVIWSPLYGAMITIALAIYQFLMLKKFIEDYYKKK